MNRQVCLLISQQTQRHDGHRPINSVFAHGRKDGASPDVDSPGLARLNRHEQPAHPRQPKRSHVAAWLAVERVIKKHKFMA
jgi:hypothetical protein